MKAALATLIERLAMTVRETLPRYTMCSWRMSSGRLSKMSSTMRPLMNAKYGSASSSVAPSPFHTFMPWITGLTCSTAARTPIACAFSPFLLLKWIAIQTFAASGTLRMASEDQKKRVGFPPLYSSTSTRASVISSDI